MNVKHGLSALHLKMYPKLKLYKFQFVFIKREILVLIDGHYDNDRSSYPNILQETDESLVLLKRNGGDYWWLKSKET